MTLSPVLTATPSKFSPQGAIYPFTTERLDQYLPTCIRPEYPGLTICGSGDQALNSILLGVRDVCAFDINRRALWWSELKIEAVRRLGYEEFRSFYIPSAHTPDNTQLFNPQAYLRLRNALSLPARRFFDSSFLNKRSSTSAAMMAALTTRRFSEEFAVKANLYLHDVSFFRELKKALACSTVRHLHLDVLSTCKSQLPRNATVLLSNLADYPSTYCASSTGSFSTFLRSIVLPIHRSCGTGARVVVAYFYEVACAQSGTFRCEVDDPQIRKRECERLLAHFWEFQFAGMGDGTTDGVLVSDTHCTAQRFSSV
jgi:hypothetical protein